MSKRSITFVRFAVREKDEDSFQPKGVFSAVYVLLDSGLLGKQDYLQVRKDLRWFEVNLPTPKRELHSRTIFWFYSDALECISRMWAFTHLLRMHGIEVKMVTTREPGAITYSDQYQIGAMPIRPGHKRKR